MKQKWFLSVDKDEYIHTTKPTSFLIPFSAAICSINHKNINSGTQLSLQNDELKIL